MPDLEINSYKGHYSVDFISSLTEPLSNYPENTHFIIDEKVYNLYKADLEPLTKKHKVLFFEANEENKDLTKIPGLIQKLVDNGIRRNETLVAIGGGITQDITCFIATTLFRGLQWEFFPTTLLAQADSCIGSKSSINASGVKNLVGAFYPPKKIYVYPEFLKTLTPEDFKSGVGEILKVHMIDSYKSFESISSRYDSLFNSDEALREGILDSLKIKQNLIELDEFDKGPRNVMNYGHSFGHAIEAATKFGIPHGVAVTIGMDMANFFSYKCGNFSQEHFQAAHKTLSENYKEFKDVDIPFEPFLSSLGKDKKNEGKKLGLILPYDDGPIRKVFVENNEFFQNSCKEFFKEVLA